MTGEEYLFLQRNIDRVANERKEVNLEIAFKKYVYGIRGIAKLMNCSISSANRLKKSGVIDKAIIQNGRKIIIDSQLALDLMRNPK